LSAPVIADAISAHLAVRQPRPAAPLLFCGPVGIFRPVKGASIMESSSIADAVRLLKGGPEEVRCGIEMIDSAASSGDGEALERQAILEAMGCFRAPNWGRALDCLEAAAERGCEFAQRQLTLLAAAAASEADWRGLRASISIEDLVRAPAKRPLSEIPRLRVMEGFASASECAWLIERAKDRLARATVVEPTGSQNVRAARTNSAIEFQVADMDVVIETIRARISVAINLPLPLFEPSQVLHYATGQEFRPHCDYFDPTLPGHAERLRHFGQRIATVLIYLNDDYSGGETAFPSAGLSFRGKTGDALFMANVDRRGQPDPSTLHAGTPPQSGEKWIFSQWVGDKVAKVDPAAAAVAR
jgi:prolyl 4-hydroxylase